MIFFRVQMALGARHMSHYWELLGGVKHVLFSTLIGMIQIVFFYRLKLWNWPSRKLFDA